MTPYYDHAGVTLYHGNALDVLLGIEDGSVNCCITSPPYWGLRDYGTAKWSGGDADCKHTQGRPGSGRADGIVDERGQRNRDGVGSMGGNCRKCGATREDHQLGLEATPEEYVAKMVAIFAEVRRVLSNDGTLWLNLGDSYATGAGKVKDCPGGGEQGERWIGKNDSKGRGTPTKASAGSGEAKYEYYGPRQQPNRMPLPGLKPKDLIGIPWRVAFALQADGWYLRSEIIWHKPNPMPESVQDRPTKSHEQIFLLSKSQKYFYDAEAIKEPVTGNSHARGDGINPKAAKWPNAWSSEPGRHDGIGNGRFRPKQNESFSGAVNKLVNERNKRSVWTVATAPFPEAHFATFPPDLILPCVLAGCPTGGLIMDPFSGAGTTAMVAKENGRRCIGIELNKDYIEMSVKRIRQDVLPLQEEPDAPVRRTLFG